MTLEEYNSCVDRYSDGIYRFALKSLHDCELAKDVVQDGFLRLWENRAAVVTGKEKSYLFTVAYHLIIDRVREMKKSAKEFLPQTLERLPSENYHQQQYSDLSEVMLQHLDALPEQYKQLVMLRDYEGYSYKEVAEIARLSEAQVKVYLFRARLALKERIGDIRRLI